MPSAPPSDALPGGGGGGRVSASSPSRGGFAGAVAALHGRLVRHAPGPDDPLSERTTAAAPLEHGVRASVGRHEAEAEQFQRRQAAAAATGTTLALKPPTSINLRAGTPS